MARIIWSDSATDDLRSIGQFYERTSPSYASTVVTDLYTSVSRLRQFPRSGRVVPELDDDSIRELLVQGFRIVYEIRGERIRIVVLLHSRQDLSDKLG